jgi:hypothetical protein
MDIDIYIRTIAIGGIAAGSISTIRIITARSVACLGILIT